MNVRQLIFRNLKGNFKNYYLYVFALIFSVAIYFAFVTLQYDPALEEAKGSVKGAAALRAGSVVLVAIVAVFNLYANNMFVKRRSKEIGLLQLIGLTKGRIFRILSAENVILYFGSLIAGIFVGLSISRLVLMILLNLTGLEAEAALRFSGQAFRQTVLVYAGIYLLIMLVNYTFIRRQTILSLFRVVTTAEMKVRKVTAAEAVTGLIGLVLILFGYYVSSELFGGRFTTTAELFAVMLAILASVIIGTYLFYRGSVRLICNIIRKRKAGYLEVKDVMSLTSIMFRMKSNALLLTVITTVSALAIGLLSLSYISYYSAEKTAEQNVPAHFSITDRQDAETFKQALAEKGITYREKVIDVVMAQADLSEIIAEGSLVYMKTMVVPVVSDRAAGLDDLGENEMQLAGFNDLLSKFWRLTDSGQVRLLGKSSTIETKFAGKQAEFILPLYFTGSGNTVIVDDAVFQRLAADQDPELQKKHAAFIGIDIEDKGKLQQANDIFSGLGYDQISAYASRSMTELEMKASVGLIMFIVGFLGLVFLVTSGCILYFKQMDESEDEKPAYTILRKLGFTQQDLLKGVRHKQLFSFGIPLAVGLVHSYFAVQSGWFLFGTELWVPMIAVMALYTLLYSVFGMLSVQHYRQVIRGALRAN